MIEKNEDIIEVKIEDNSDEHNFDEHNFDEHNFDEDNLDEHKKKKSIFDNNFIRLLIALFVLACCAGLGAGIAVVEEKSDPTGYVAEYFGKFLVKDFEGMYKYVDVGENAIAKDDFIKMMSDLKSQTNVGKYEFTDPVKKGDRYLVKVKYEDAGTEEKKTFDIYLYKNGGVAGNFFAKWTVSARDYVVEEFFVKIPASMKAQFDGKDIDESLVCNADNAIRNAKGEIIVLSPKDSEDLKSTKTYRLTDIVMGSHDVYVYSDYMEMGRSVDIFESGKIAGFAEAQASIKKQNLEAMEKSSVELIKEYYEAVRNRKSTTKKLLSYFVDDKKLKKKLARYTEDSQKLVFWPGTRNIDDYSLVGLNFSDLKHEVTYKGNGLYSVVYTYSYNYLSSTDTSVSTSYIFELEGTVNSTMTLTYKVVGDKLLVSDFSLINKNKKSK